MIQRPGHPLQREFAAALLDPSRAIPTGLCAWNGSDVTARVAVYRNNVVASLVQALAEAFPVVRQLVGEKFFAAMASAYVRAHPPHSPVLAEYGDSLADWLAGFVPAASLPYLSDMARLERARVLAYHAADATALAPEAIARHLATPDRLARTRLRLHPSAAVVASDWAIVSLWAAHQREGEAVDAAIAAVTLDRAEGALVLRDHDQVLVLPIQRAQAAFIHALLVGESLGAAITAASLASAADEPFDLVGALSLLIHHDALVQWRSPGENE